MRLLNPTPDYKFFPSNEVECEAAIKKLHEMITIRTNEIKESEERAYSLNNDISDLSFQIKELKATLKDIKHSKFINFVEYLKTRNAIYDLELMLSPIIKERNEFTEKTNKIRNLLEKILEEKRRIATIKAFLKTDNSNVIPFKNDTRTNQI